MSLCEENIRYIMDQVSKSYTEHVTSCGKRFFTYSLGNRGSVVVSLVVDGCQVFLYPYSGGGVILGNLFVCSVRNCSRLWALLNCLLVDN